MNRHTLLLFAATLAACISSDDYEPRNGDIVFHTSRSAQSQAIQLATHSPYSHMGIVYVRDGAPFVFEAVQPVKLTPLDDWIARGESGRFVAKRLRNADTAMTPAVVQKMRAVGERFAGKDYDLYFEWSDDRIYCSELVWKVFDEGARVSASARSRRSRTSTFRIPPFAPSSRSASATGFRSTRSSCRRWPYSTRPSS